ncbi:MAG: 16S rRNA (guanine(527)-N(7))-methyltransferase RsmG [Solirubrobacteraceae bacterium]
MTALESGLDELVRRYALPTSALTALQALLELLAGDPTAPTALRDPQRVLEDHLADALVGLELEPVRAARRVADLGSGAGVPGLPLAIAKPTSSFALIESNGRNSQFIGDAAATCGLRNVEVINERVEAWRDGMEGFELVTARALAPLAVVAEYAAPLLTQGGSLVAWRGMRDPAVESDAAIAARALGLGVVGVRAVQPHVGARRRHLHVLTKERPTPSSFPRRPGMARKRPLGQRTKPV